MDTFDLIDLRAVTEETLQKATETSGIYTSLGIEGIDLTGLISLINVPKKFRDSVPRVTPSQGSLSTQWRALLNVNPSQPNAAVQLDYAGPRANYEEVNVSTNYYPLEMVTTVTRDAVMIARSYADALAVGTLQNLNQVLISEDINLINAWNFPLPTIGIPTFTTSSTGGTIASGAAVHVKVAARSGNNYYYGGSQAAGSDGTVTVGTLTSTYSVVATVAAVKGAAAYDWFVGSSNSNQQYYTTTSTNTVLITAIYTAPQALPSQTALPLLNQAVVPTTPPTADSSYNATSWMNGLFAQVLGDYVSNTIGTPGSGTSSNAYWASANGSSFTAIGAGIQQLDDLNMSLMQNAYISPTRYLMNPQQAADLTTLMTESGLAYTVLPPTDTQARSNLAAGQYVKWYLNKAAGGVPVRIETHLHIPPGRIVAISDMIDYPGANIDAPISVRTLDDYYAFEYAANYNPGVQGGGPRNDLAVRTFETLVVRAPVTCGIIQDLASTEA